MIRIMMALGLATAGTMGLHMSAAKHPIQPDIVCSADGEKAFAPALTPDQICDHFRRALGGRGQDMRVDLRFSMRGLASAQASVWRAGRWETLPLFEMAVMDRRFNLSDIDRLAGDVVVGMTTDSRTEEG